MHLIISPLLFLIFWLHHTACSQLTVLVAQSCPTLCDPMDWTARLLCPWDFPGKSTGVSSCSPVKWNLANQGSEPDLHVAGRLFTI